MYIQHNSAQYEFHTFTSIDYANLMSAYFLFEVLQGL